MLSKKMAFSLMSLTTVFALLLIALPTFAAEITIKVKDADGGTTGDQGDLSAKDGIQVAAGTDVLLNIETDELFGQFPMTDPPTDPATNDISMFTIVSSKTPAPMIVDTVTDPAATGEIMRSADGKMYTLTLDGDADDSVVAAGTTVTIFLMADKFQSLTAGEAKHNSAIITLEYIDRDQIVPAAVTATVPKVVSIARADGLSHPITEASVTLIVTLSEMPKEFKKDKITLDKATLHAFSAHGTVDSPETIEQVAEGGTAGVLDDEDKRKAARDANQHTGNEFTTLPADAATIDAITGYTGKLYRYAVTINPTFTGDIKFTVNQFEDLFGNKSADPAKKEQVFKVSESLVTPDPGKDGTEYKIPQDLIIPAGGYLIVAADDGDGSTDEEKVSDSLITWPGDPKEATARINLRKPAQRTYNITHVALPNLATELINGATIDLISPESVVISEIMWATDGGSKTRQWIEIMNTSGKELKTGDGTYKLKFYSATETVPPMTAAVAATATTAAVPAGLPAGVADRVGTLYKGAHWSLAGKGQSGRTSDTRTLGASDIEIVATSSLVSMQRVMKTDGMYADGTMSSSWVQSMPPSDNFHTDAKGLLIGTPGFSPIISEAARMAAAAAEKAKTDAAAAKAKADAEAKMAMGTVPEAGNIYISEVMFAGGGSLPQWIEIANSSRTEEVNLAGWTLKIDNAKSDTDVSVGAIEFTIPKDTMIGMYGQNDEPSTILIVTELGRYDLGKGASQVLNLWQDGPAQDQLIIAGVNKRRYSLLSSDAFLITLAPPMPAATTPPATETPAAKATRLAAERVAADARKAATDMVGNLGADGAAAWALPMSEEGGRSSIIRTHVQVSIGPAEPNDGTMMDGWVLASDTAFAQPQHVLVKSYYGAANDSGTPGFRAGGALPVELSSFRPARDKATGAVVITWSTQSELNNAGFFIKRSQQRTGEFKVINATMVAGAGTTSEKQFYTYTDTTAQPNVVYYYQIEDVSLDGQRQTLTRGIRLKGHVGAAGKATTLWGELKSSNE